MEYKDKSINELQNIILEFVDERNWRQFQTPKNMSMYLSIEAAELMEHFLWCESATSKDTLQEKRTDVEHELADILYWVLNFAAQNDINLSQVLERKMVLNRAKYPIEKAKDNSQKYTEYPV
jgi:NTP pyrophosphatase (non-canonical NTP hydrolase)